MIMRVPFLVPLVMLSAVAWAQEEDAAEEPATEQAASEEPVAEAEPADATAAEETASAETLETIPVDEAAPGADVESLPLYVGVDSVLSTLSVSDLDGFASRNYDSGMYRLRAGAKPIEHISIELHYGFDNGGEGPDEVTTDSYYGLFVVPTANFFNTVELTFPAGYANSSVQRPGASADLRSIAYGLAAELPIRRFGAGLPDLRISAGGMAYCHRNDARIYGVNLGLSYVFGGDTSQAPSGEAPAE